MKLSVVIITYNHERYIAQAIESALAQKVNFPYEIVIGEDCSTDGTRAIVADFARRYPGKIRPLFRTHNLGANRNLADVLANCRGDYLAVLEGDDYWTATDKLQRQIDLLDADPDCVICCTRARVLDEASGAATRTNPDLPPGQYQLNDLLKGNFIPTCTAVLRRQSAGPLPDWVFRMRMSDWPLWALAARHGSIELMDEVTATYRMHTGGVWSSLSRSQGWIEVARMLKALDKELRFEYTGTITEAIAPRLLQLAVEARSNGKRTEVAKLLMNWLRYGGLRLPVNPRLPGGLLTYLLIGSGYKIFSRAHSTARTGQ
jgi:glycosyltransferase involved in cell wall biosynthesis